MNQEELQKKVEDLLSLIPDGKNNCVFAVIAGEHDDKVEAGIMFQGSCVSFVKAMGEAISKDKRMANMIYLAIKLAKLNSSNFADLDTELDSKFMADIINRMISKINN